MLTRRIALPIELPVLALVAPSMQGASFFAMIGMARVVFENALLFDGQQILSDKRLCVVVDGSSIEGVFESAPAPRPDEIRIDLAGKMLMPGLIDAHFHSVSPTFDIPSMDRMAPSYRALTAKTHLEGALLRGFTTVRDAGGGDIGLVRAIEEGHIKGPRLLISGKALSQTGGHGDMRPSEWIEPCGCAGSGALATVVDGVDQMRLTVREQLRQGANQIKLFVSGGVLSPTDPIWMNQFSDEEIKAAVYEAATRRTYVMAHAHTSEAARRCVALGVRTIEHGTLIDRATADALAAAGAYVVPTLAVIDCLTDGSVKLPPASMEKLKRVGDSAHRAVEFCVAAGVKVGLGTDLFGPVRHRQSEELSIRATLHPVIDVLRSATAGNADLINQSESLGRIAAGKSADLLVLAGDASRDIRILSSPDKTLQLIMCRGDIVKNTLGDPPR